MPIVRDLPVSFDIRRVLQRQGFRDFSKVRPAMKAMTEKLIGEVEETHLIQSAAAYEIYRIEEILPEKMLLEGGRFLDGDLLPRRLPGAAELAVMVCTIGPALENRVKEYTGSRDALRGMLLDGIGSAAADNLARSVYMRIAEETAPRGYTVAVPVSPGMKGLDISQHGKVIEYAGGEALGITLSETGLMHPRKSTSRIMGIGKDMKVWT
jgi:hypothetical protein